jgi:hypothetical protein
MIVIPANQDDGYRYSSVCANRSDRTAGITGSSEQ